MVKNNTPSCRHPSGRGECWVQIAIGLKTMRGSSPPYFQGGVGGGFLLPYTSPIYLNPIERKAPDFSSGLGGKAGLN